jgi:hypothetical protein
VVTTDTRKPRSRVSASATPRRSRRRAASSSTPLTARGGVVLIFVASVVGSLLGSATGIAWASGAAFTIACLVAVLGVRPRDLLGLTVSPPATYFVVAVLMALWGPSATPGAGASAGGVGVRLVTDLIAATPWLFVGTLLVLGIATLRGLPDSVRELNSLLAAERDADGSGDDAHGADDAAGADDAGRDDDGGDDGFGSRPAGTDDGDRDGTGVDADGDAITDLGAGVSVGESVGVHVSVGDRPGAGEDERADDDHRGGGRHRESGGRHRSSGAGTRDAGGGATGDAGGGSHRTGASDRGTPDGVSGDGERDDGAAVQGANPRSRRRKATPTRSARRALHRRRRRSLPAEDPVRWDEEPPL